eukprot:GHRR01019751.1.p1 GENE.GHRR01019751.1~~GHRR01019751.1.p1  ORF type:complete len:285 (+),score=71.93 GHRR01019751.1:235-1089(+)
MWHIGSNHAGDSSYPEVNVHGRPSPSAPPLYDPLQQYNQHQQSLRREHQQPQHSQSSQRLPPGTVLVTTPKLEAQPWAKTLWKNLAARTVGVARVDLRRPVFLWPEEYDTGNILFKRSSQAVKRGRGRPRKQPPVTGYVSDYDGSYYPAPPQQQMYPNVPSPYGPDGRLLTPVVAGQQPAHRQQPTGARLKVTRCVQLKAPENKRALLDFGIGVGVDLDRQEVHGVARLKVADLLSIKLLPQPLLKLGGAWSLPGTGMALRLKYEAPLVHLNEFWQPPARLMVR